VDLLLSHHDIVMRRKLRFRLLSPRESMIHRDLRLSPEGTRPLIWIKHPSTHTTRILIPTAPLTGTVRSLIPMPEPPERWFPYRNLTYPFMFSRLHLPLHVSERAHVEHTMGSCPPHYSVTQVIIAKASYHGNLVLSLI
jgi:hypothetical protein